MTRRYHVVQRTDTSPSLLGVELGVVNRATCVGFTKQNYYDQDGKFNTGLGLARTGLAAVESIGTDALIYGGADRIWAKKFKQSRGDATYNPILTTGIAAGAFNMTTAAGAEVTRQIDNGKFEPLSLASRSFSAGLVGLGAGTLAGLQKRSFLSLEIKDGPTALRDARSTPFQLGHLVDEAQVSLRDGTFVAEKKIIGPTGVSWVGKVANVNGETPAIFRVNDGSEAFAHRMQSEIAGYGLHNEIGFKSIFPTTVARSVDVEGQQVSGFIQEIRGTNLMSHFANQGVEQSGLQLDRKQLIENLNQNPGLKKSLAESWAERMTYGEWDNHSLNQIVERTADGDAAGNIDLGDGLRAAKTQLDLVPNAGLLRSYERSNSYIYKELGGKPLDPEIVQKMQSFVDRSSSDAGRQKIQDLGLTPQQAEGVLGRTQWFASNKVLPNANETEGYYATSQVAKPLKAGLRYVKRTIKSALQ